VCGKLHCSSGSDESVEQVEHCEWAVPGRPNERRDLPPHRHDVNPGRRIQGWGERQHKSVLRLKSCPRVPDVRLPGPQWSVVLSMAIPSGSRNRGLQRNPPRLNHGQEPGRYTSLLTIRHQRYDSTIDGGSNFLREDGDPGLYLHPDLPERSSISVWSGHDNSGG